MSPHMQLGALVGGGLLITLTLDTATMPVWLHWLYPQWTATLIIYWALQPPKLPVGLTFAWGVGLFLDALNGTLWGQQALALALAWRIAMEMRVRMNVTVEKWQQSVLVFFPLLIVNLSSAIIDLLMGREVAPLPILTTAAVGAMLYPYIAIAMIRQRLRIPEDSRIIDGKMPAE